MVALQRLTFVISDMAAGGAERVTATMANRWAEQGVRVTILTFAPSEADSFYPLATGVRLENLALRAHSESLLVAMARNLRRLATLRRRIAASRPDVVIACMDTTNVLTLLATVGLRVPVIVEEHADPATTPLRAPWAFLRRIMYRRAAAVVAVTSTALSYFPAPIRRRGVVIPNPVVVPAGFEPRADAQAEPVVVGMGRFTYEKGFDLLIRAFARGAADYPAWRLDIWGDGPLLPDLQRLAVSLGVRDRVQFRGLTSRPVEALSRARIFVLPSRFESFGIALCEAMAAGLAVAAFDCPSGPREVVSDGHNGILVPREDVTAMAAAIQRLIDDAGERERLGASARLIVNRLAPTVIMPAWDRIVASAVRGRG